jgi:ribosomal protein S3AE|tara:strand:- start:46 stop:723 length:678 start_codon:yes stop_codon:yes gene_type:complete
MAKKTKTKKTKTPIKIKEKPISRKKKGAKKKFFAVDLPLTAAKVKLYSYSAEDLSGSMVKIDLTKSMRGKNLELKARIQSSQNRESDELTGELVSLKLMQSYLKRVMRRGSDYIEDSFITNSKDHRLIIKPFMITRKKVSRAVRNEIRKKAKKYLESHTKIRTTEDLFSEIMTSKLQKELSLKVKKIYPLSLCEIRVIEVLGPINKTQSQKKSPISKEEKDSKEE